MLNFSYIIHLLVLIEPETRVKNSSLEGTAIGVEQKILQDFSPYNWIDATSTCMVNE